MAHITHETRFDLGHNEFVVLKEAKTATLTCEAGELWITQDRGSRDFVLKPGQRMEIDADRQIFVSAFVLSSVTIHQADHCAPGATMSRKLYATVVNWAMPKLFGIPATMLR